ncbi:MAG TPA: phage holin family protein [Roseiarcus sp.]|nr:phage holin family protein [Roseiarcus sp.]
MRNEIVALAQHKAAAAARRAAVPAALGIAAAILFLFAVAGLLAALFFWLAPLYGPSGAALIAAATAFVLGLLAIAPLAFKRRPQPAPAPDATLSQVVLQVAQSAPSLGPRQAALAAFLLAIALGLIARGSSDAKK